MKKLLFLGTGPTGGILGKSKFKRLESSALITTDKTAVLIDVTRNFDRQKELVKRLDAVFITHGHRDAIGGIPALLKWQKDNRLPKISIYSLVKTLTIIKRNYGQLESLNLIPVQPFKTFTLFDLIITPISVAHSIQVGYPTVGYYIEFKGDGDGSLAYISDVGSWKPQAEQFMRWAKILIVDGSMWKKKIKSHLTIDEVLPIFRRWPNKRIIFTHIGRTVPEQEVLSRELKRICAKASAAYDGMCVNL